jgi:hypothetical protein
MEFVGVAVGEVAVMFGADCSVALVAAFRLAACRRRCGRRELSAGMSAVVAENCALAAEAFPSVAGEAGDEPLARVRMLLERK